MASPAKCAERQLLWELTSLKDAGRRSDGEMNRFLQIARGSANEVEYHLLLAKDLGFLSTADFQNLEAQVFEIQRMLTSFVARLRAGLQARS